MIFQHYQFNSQQYATSETVAEYVVALLKLAEHCNFRNTLDEMLRDRLVCGIAHKQENVSRDKSSTRNWYHCGGKRNQSVSFQV